MEKTKYRFGLSPNLNKLLADRRASVETARIDERIRQEILKVFEKEPGVEMVPFPEKSNQIPDRPVLSLVIMPPDLAMSDTKTMGTIEGMIREYGTSARTYKSGLVFSMAANDAALRDEARKLLAWQAIKDEEEDKLDDAQQAQLIESLKKAQRDLKESVWRTYNHLAVLGKDNRVRTVDLGLVSSSQARTMTRLIVDHLRKGGEIEPNPSPNLLVRNWPGFIEWSTKAVRDAFFASPVFPRLLDGDAIKDTIARGVSSRILAYVGKAGGQYKPFVFDQDLKSDDVEISDDMFIITAEEAKKHIEPPKLMTLTIRPERPQVKPGTHMVFQVQGLDQHGRPMESTSATWSAKGGEIDSKGGFKAGTEEGEFRIEVEVGNLRTQTTVVITKQEVLTPKPPPPPDKITGLKWSGEVPQQKWMNFYTKVLSKYATTGGLKLTVTFEVNPSAGLSPQRLEETKAALHELGLDDQIEPM